MCTCRLSTWLAELGPKSAEVLKSCMDLMAKGIIVPTAGKKLFPQNDSSHYACIDHVVSIARELEHQGRKQTQGTRHAHLDAYLHVPAG